MTLARAERLLRQDDKALRLRHSLEGPNILVERKTFRGRIGSVSKQLGTVWAPDGGARRELGHVLVATIHRDTFDVHVLRDALRSADSWRYEEPSWKRAEESDARRKAAQVRTRKDGMRYKASNLYDNYVWKYKSRVNVPVQVA
jgi:hypothetical protein